MEGLAGDEGLGLEKILRGLPFAVLFFAKYRSVFNSLMGATRGALSIVPLGSYSLTAFLMRRDGRGDGERAKLKVSPMHRPCRFNFDEEVLWQRLIVLLVEQRMLSIIPLDLPREDTSWFERHGQYLLARGAYDPNPFPREESYTFDLHRALSQVCNLDRYLAVRFYSEPSPFIYI